ncbi:MAG: DUF1553 domain-containing protein [Acidobacteria bacterium]|nr:DUF1553 domain-containing protein [Acidobacteriota bacterium]
MPPKYAHKELTERQKELIRQWVAEGAVYEGHWAYQPVRRPQPPGIAPSLHPIDAFIQARLAREGLTASPEADRRTLIRRLALDLTGIPPSPAEVDAFVRDKSPRAYEKLVDRLVASPRYAERQAQHWLDAVRYADTCGFHGDNPIPAWPYRDYVLRAFRDNMPFDQFTREQLAGDLLPNATRDQKVASAYNRLNRTSAEGGVQPKEYLAKYAADRVRTTSTVWLGATMGCAECHDHKFDPITARDFYSFKAFFADIKETGLVPDRGARAWGSQLALPTADQQGRLDQIQAKLKLAREALERKTSELESDREWERKLLDDHRDGRLAWRFQRPVSAESAHGVKLAIYNDEPVESSTYSGASLATSREPGHGLVVASGPNPDNETYTVSFRPGAGEWTALGIEIVQDESLPGVRVARGSDRLIVTEVEADLGGERLGFALATSNVASPFNELPPYGAIDAGPSTGWGIVTYGENKNLFLALRFTNKVRTAAVSVMTVRLHQDSEHRQATIGRFRLALSSAGHSWPEASDTRRRSPAEAGLPADVAKALATPETERTAEQCEVLRHYRQWISPDLAPLLAEVEKLDAARRYLELEIPRVVVTESVRPSVTRILARGNWMDDSGEIVEPAIPAFIGKLQASGRATRLDLANWIASPENPLTARVFVNRLWSQFFVVGISKTVDDLGSQGEWPSYPELLDWLAAEFMQPSSNAAGAHPWDIRHLIRTIVLSRTYRQTSKTTPQLDERDPGNRLLARQSRFRVDAETVRDIALAASGLLVEQFGGPSARPYQPQGYLAALNFPKREYSPSRGEQLYRRGLYTHWQRTFLHPSLLAFDAPTREECTVNRTSSNTPLQALVLLNDPIYVEAARVFAQNILKHGGRGLAARLDWAFHRALGRAPSREERRILQDLHRTTLARFTKAPAAAAELVTAGEAPRDMAAKPASLAAMTVVARAILNLHETITRN